MTLSFMLESEERLKILISLSCVCIKETPSIEILVC